MKIMFFDTETGGKEAKEFDILQLSYQIVSFPTFEVLKQQNFYFSRDRETSCEAIAINGLTDEYLSGQMITQRNCAMKEFLIDLSECDLLVAHCLNFDKEFIYHTCRRTHYSKRFHKVFENIKTYDTMRETTSLCCLPYTAARPYQHESKYKYPKLSELAQFLNIRTDDIKLHDSKFDTTLTVRCFMKLVEIGWVNISAFQAE